MNAQFYKIFFFIGEQIKVNQYRTKCKMIYIALCIVVQYMNGKKVIYIYINIYKPDSKKVGTLYKL